MSKSIPDRWLDYKPYGDVITGTKIVAFKVPLKETVAKNLQPEQRFTTAVLMKAFPKMKYIIDLTNTARYYDQADFTNAGIKYQKVMIPGMQVPPLECVKRFFKAMENFTAECGEDEIIGVHCTHGVNRSGYLICRFLTQQLGWSHSDALKYFHEARGYPIERATYIADLKRQPVGTKIDVSKVDLSAPMKIPKQRPNMKHLGPRPPFPPMAPPGPPMPPRRFLNGAPFPPPPGKFGPPRAPAFGPPRPPPPMAGAPPPPRGPPMFGPPRPPRGPFGPMPPPPPGPMRHHPGPMPPPGPPPGMRIPGPPRPLPMGPPVPPPRPHPGMAPRIGPPGPQRHPPPPPMRMLPPGKMAPPAPRPNTRAAKQQQLQQQQQQQPVRDQDFTADVFEENLTAKPTRNARKRPYPRN